MVNRQLFTMLGQSRAFAQVIKEARFVSATDFNVLLAGESGVGKGLIAQFIHENSPRRQRTMLSQHCAGVAQSQLETDLFDSGLLERAHGSTLLLTDVGEMGSRLQARLLRFLENGEASQGSDVGNEIMDVRIIAATNRDLLQRPSEQEFCVDLYYRLNVAHLQMPPLRECREDISFLVRNYLKILSERLRLPLCELDPGALSALEGYSWPRNISELREVAQLLALTHAGRVVTVNQLPERILAEQSPQPRDTGQERLFAFLQQHNSHLRPRPLRAAIDDAVRVTPTAQRKAVRVRKTSGPSIRSSRQASVRARA